VELVQQVSGLMTAPPFASFLIVLAGSVFARRRTITRMLLAADAVKTPDRADVKHHSALHRVFAAARWSRDELGLAVFHRILPTAMLLYSLIVWWFAAEGHRHYRAPWRPCYRSKSGVCFTDMLNTLRLQSVRHQVLSLRRAARGNRKLVKTLFHAVRQAA
jgi:hypothetical protein